MDQWQRRKRPVRLERRFEFQTYEETRNFLDRLGLLSEKTKKFPDISFGKTYVNLTIRPEEEEEEAQLTAEDEKFSKKIDMLLS
tara:strand:+ start:353 stop:604 length:252 start_codon:yes stop_codon:yes gene_type:complete